MADKRERDAAYFTLLRARKELDDLRRHSEWLVDEQRRVRRFQAESAAAADTIPARLRRPLGPVDTALAETFEARLGVLADEIAKMPARIEDAEAFVVECEAEQEALRR
jgi:hypothetical protein